VVRRSRPRLRGAQGVRVPRTLRRDQAAIKAAIETLFKVSVTAVRTMIMRPSGARTAAMPAPAVLEKGDRDLKEGDAIEVFEG